MRIAPGHLAPALVSLLILATLSGCGTDYEYREVAIDSFQVIAQNETSILFQITGQWPNTCGEVSRIDAVREGDTFSLRMIGREPEDVACGGAVIDISDTWQTKVESPGSYRFQFLRLGTAPLDTTIVF